MHGATAPANRATRRPLTKDTKQETIILNRSGRSTYPEEKSVQTSGATPMRYAHLEKNATSGKATDILNALQVDKNRAKLKVVS